MGTKKDLIEDNCLTENGNVITDFDLLDDCRVVGNYTAATENTVVISGGTNFTDSLCFDLVESGDHTDEWLNYTGMTAIISPTGVCDTVDVVINDNITYDSGTDTTTVCFDGDLSSLDFNCYNTQDSVNVEVVTTGVTTGHTADLSKECCTDALNFNWDEDEGVCRWCVKQDCKPGDLFKIILGSDQNNGGFFEQENDEDCYLEVEFDYLFKYDCTELNNCVTGGTANTINSIFSLDIDVNVEKDVEDYTGFTANYETQYTEELFNVDDPVSYLDENDNTGILLEGDGCNNVINKTKNGLGIYCGVIDDSSFNSGWLHHKMTITNESILSAITNEHIYLSFTVNDWNCNFYVLTDNIEINKKCQKEEVRPTTVTTCPGFDLRRVEDNRKSWVANEEEINRFFDFKDRFTDYDIDHHDLAINSKEIDLRFDIPNAVETKVMDYIEDNPCILEGEVTDLDCCCSGDSKNVNILDKIDRSVTSFTTTDIFREEFYQNFIDPRSRLTLRNYPILRAIYDRYLNPDEYCSDSEESGEFDYFQMENFSKLVGDYWVDIIEQFIPSTTIWGSTFLYGNTIFDNNKFDYRRYSLLTCCDDEDMVCPSGFTLTPEGDRCVKTDTVSASTADTVYDVNKADRDESFGKNGARFHEDITNLPKPLDDNSGNNEILDDSGNAVQVEAIVSNPLWGTGSTNTGRLNEVGVWTDQSGSPTGEWIGFSYCLDIPESGVYSVGMAADNKCRFRVNDDLIATLDDGTTFAFDYWFVFPYHFGSGINIIEMEGLNVSAGAAFGAEIYSADTETLSGLTSESELSGYTIFSTSEIVGGVFELGDDSGFSCPSGYTLDTCSSGTPVCTKIEETEFVATSGKCQDTNATPLSKIGAEYIDVVQRDVTEILDPDQLAPHTTGQTTSNTYDPLISYTANTTANTITNININDGLLNEFYLSGLTNNDINGFLLTATTSDNVDIGPYFKRNDDFDYIFTGITSSLNVVSASTGTTTATTVGVVDGTTTYYSGLTFNAPECVDVERQTIDCPYIYTVNMDVGSEFIGTVTKIPK